MHQFKCSEFNLEPAELSCLIRHAPTLRDQAMVSIFVYTGIRRAELRGIALADIDWTRRRIRIVRGKGGKERVVFLCPELSDMLTGYARQRQQGPLFAGRHGRPLTVRAINNVVANVGERAGIRNPNPRYKHVTPHLLRHSFARNWKRAGGSLETLQKILGHASLQTTMDVYGTQGLEETEVCYAQTYRHLVR